MENSRFTEIDFKINISVTDLIALMYYLGKYRWMSAVVCQHQIKNFTTQLKFKQFSKSIHSLLK